MTQFDPSLYIKNIPKVKKYFDELKQKVIVKDRRKDNFFSYGDKYKYKPAPANTFKSYRPNKENKNFFKVSNRKGENAKI